MGPIRSFPRWLTAALALAVGAVVATGFWFYTSQAAHLQAETEARLEGIARLKAEQITAWRERLLADAAVAAENPLLCETTTRAAASPPQDGTDAGVTRGCALMRQHGYTGFALLDAGANVVCGAGEPVGTSRKDTAQLVERALREDRPVLSEAFPASDGSGPRIMAVAPLREKCPTARHEPVAVALQTGLREPLRSAIESWPTPARTARTLLIRPERDSVLVLTDLRHRPESAMKLRIPLTHREVTAVMAAAGQRGVLQGSDYRGRQVLSAVRAIPSSNWLLLAEIEVDEALAGWRFRSAAILLATGLILLGTASAACLVWLRGEKEHYRRLAETRHALAESEALLSATLRSIGDAVVCTDADGNVTSLNIAAERLTGWTSDGAQGKPAREVLRIVDTETGEPAEHPIERALADQATTSATEDAALIDRNGMRRRIAHSCAPIRDPSSSVLGAVFVFRDTTEDHRLRQLAGIRLALLEFAVSNSLDALLSRALDDISAAVDSPVGFYHFVEADQQTIIMQQWSTRTRQEFCQVPDGTLHQKLDHAGVWADCIRQKRPVIHNDYASLPHKKGTPEGHAEIVRELVVPVIRDDRIVAVLGVGNKPTDYTERDVEIVSYLADVTWEIVEHKRTHEALVASEERYRTLVESSRDAIMTLDPESWRFTSCNQAAVEMFRAKNQDHLSSVRLWDLSPQFQPDGQSSADKAREMIEAASAQGYHFFEWNHLRFDGTGFPATVLLVRTEIAGRPVYQATVRDVTSQKRTEAMLLEKEKRYRSLWECAVEGLCLCEIVTDDSGRAVDYRVLEVNRAFEHAMGVTSNQIEGRPGSEVFGSSPPPYLDIFARVATTGVSAEFEAYVESNDRHFNVSVFSPHPGQFAASWSDVSDRKAYERELEQRSIRDPLTGLLNRQGFEMRLEECMEAGEKDRNSPLIVLFIDLDKFKVINDTMGHKAGDLLLVEVARRLQSCVRADDALARIGGDEFTAFLPRCRRKSSAEAVASRMLKALSNPFDINGRRFMIGASIGIAAAPPHGTDPATLLKHADAAMYGAKQDFGSSIKWFGGDADSDLQARLELESDIFTALQENQLLIYYQPIVRLSDGSVWGAEALLRWEHPKKGMISPSLFIPIAERTGLIESIGNWVLQSACSQAREWIAIGLPVAALNVNVSAKQLASPRWAETVKKTLAESGLNPACLRLELTESDLAADRGSAAASLRKVRELGASICIDDFGVGQSSLSRFRDFPVTDLKIDGSFLRDVEHSARDRALLHSIVDMARSQGVRVTAEWVENRGQVEFLRAIGCDFAQGFVFSPPLLPDEFVEFVLGRSGFHHRRAA